MKAKAVIFDLDGTLYDNSKLPFLVVLNDIKHIRLLSAERRCRREMVGQYFGKGTAAYDELFRRIAARTGRTEEEVSVWFNDVYLPLQAELLKRFFHPEPWVRPVLGRLKAEGVRTACFSDYGHIAEKLEALGLSRDMFDYISDAPAEGGCKPCAESFLNVASALGVRPSETLVMGDRDDTDGAGATKAGMQYLNVLRENIENLDICV